MENMKSYEDRVINTTICFWREDSLAASETSVVFHKSVDDSKVESRGYLGYPCEISCEISATTIERFDKSPIFNFFAFSFPGFIEDSLASLNGIKLDWLNIYWTVAWIRKALEKLTNDTTKTSSKQNRCLKKIKISGQFFHLVFTKKRENRKFYFSSLKIKKYLNFEDHFSCCSSCGFIVPLWCPPSFRIIVTGRIGSMRRE